MRGTIRVVGLIALCAVLSGCVTFNRLRDENAKLKNLAQNLSSDNERLQRELDSQLRDKAALEAERQRLLQQLRDMKIQVPPGVDVGFTREGNIYLRMQEAVLFDSGKALIKPSGEKVLDGVARELQTNPKIKDRDIVVEGHTDTDPIKHTKGIYRSNLELSLARAANVVHYLREKNIAPERMSAQGYGEYRPIAKNDTRENKSKNRRVEIIILMMQPPTEVLPVK